MKIKTILSAFAQAKNELLIIDILVILLILAIAFIPSNVVRIILGLPFLLFFPGYLLIAALFPRKEGMDGIERIALGFGMSIAVTALIGLGLNYTPWGIRLLPVLYSISAFILIVSVVAMLRRARLRKQKILTTEFILRLPGWGGNTFDKTLYVLLVVSILCAVGVLIYTVAFPKVGEKFTEFYIIGLKGKAQDYPAEFVMEKGQVVRVRYSTETKETVSTRGKITVGIVNHEQQKTSYSVIIKIDNTPVNIFADGQNVSQLGLIELEQEGKWEKEIGIAPQHIGENQKVEFLLYKSGSSEPYLSLRIWINVK